MKCKSNKDDKDDKDKNKEKDKDKDKDGKDSKKSKYRGIIGFDMGGTSTDVSTYDGV